MSNELKTILFLHILFALSFVGGTFAVLVLLSRARRAQSVAALRATLLAARTVAMMLVLPSGVLVGIMGFVMAARLDAKLGFDQGKAGWMQIAMLLWLIAVVAVFFFGRGLGQAIARAGEGADAGGLEAAKAVMRSPRVGGLIYLTTAIGIVTLYLMIFQPFAGTAGQVLRHGALMTKELDLILLIHVLFAMALLGGVAAHILVHLRFRNEMDPAALRATMTNLRGLENALIIGNGVLVGVLGLLLAWRYDAKGIFTFGDTRWLHVAIALWIAANVIGFLEGRSLETAYKLGEDSAVEITRLRATFNSPLYMALAVLNIVVVLVLVYLMVYQP